MFAFEREIVARAVRRVLVAEEEVICREAGKFPWGRSPK